MKLILFYNFLSILLSYAKCVSEARLHKAGVCVRVWHLDSVTVIYNVYQCSTPRTGLLSLLAALSPEAHVLTGGDGCISPMLTKHISHLMLSLHFGSVWASHYEPKCGHLK
ncbi:hypothetical protein AMECASPLE_027011 [Ameca splendens]|uniref:Secreted protein n=1 Tax=Ameca splendens TaxID=208324 RepID=A0ABV0XI27_9TELE